MPVSAKCKDGRKHDWKMEKTKEGMAYQKCRRCGQVRLVSAR